MFTRNFQFLYFSIVQFVIEEPKEKKEGIEKLIIFYSCPKLSVKLVRKVWNKSNQNFIFFTSFIPSSPFSLVKTMRKCTIYLDNDIVKTNKT
jgi:hypothetical protein